MVVIYDFMMGCGGVCDVVITGSLEWPHNACRDNRTNKPDAIPGVHGKAHHLPCSQDETLVSQLCCLHAYYSSNDNCTTATTMERTVLGFGAALGY